MIGVCSVHALQLLGTEGSDRTLAEMSRIEGRAPAAYKAQVNDTRKRIEILFDHLNNEELVKPDTIEQLTKLAQALESKDYPESQRLQVEIQRDKTEECGNWMVC